MSVLATLGLALCVIGMSVTSGANAQATTVGTAFTAIPTATMQGRSPRLTVERGGAVLSWLERTEDGHALHAARIHGGQLESLVKVTDGKNWFINPFDRPSVVALSKTNLAAHWLQRTSSNPYGYGIRMAFSHDNGNTWGPVIVPHRDRAPVQHGFAYLQPTSSQSVRIAWLDGGEQAAGKAVADPMALLSANIDTNGRVTNRMVLDEQVCTCCQPALHQTATGWLAAYRDRSSTEIRDISVAAVDKRGISARTNLIDGWTMNGCPLNGPTIASNQGHVAVAWFTAARDVPAVRIALSSNNGTTFDAPIDVASQTPLGQVSEVALADGSFLVGWVEFNGAQLAYRVRRMAKHANAPSSHVVLRSDAVIASPQMACVEGLVYLAWEAMGTNTIHLARLASKLSPCTS